MQIDRQLPSTEAAQVVGVSPDTLNKWRLQKKGPPFRKIGRTVRYAQSELIAWLNSRPRGGDPLTSAEPKGGRA